jgi:hypothetical protein
MTSSLSFAGGVAANKGIRRPAGSVEMAEADLIVPSISTYWVHWAPRW